MCISVTFSTKVSAVEIKDNVLESYSMEELKSEKPVRTLKNDDFIMNKADIRVKWSYSFTNKNYKAGDYFYTSIPEGIDVPNPENGPLSSTAKFEIDPNTRKIKIEFTQNVSSAKYTLTFNTKLYFSNLKTPMLKTFDFNLATNNQPLKLNVQGVIPGVNEHNVTFLDVAGKPTNYMPAKGTVTSVMNKYQQDGGVDIVNRFDVSGIKMIVDPLSIEVFIQSQLADGTLTGEKRKLNNNEYGYYLDKSDGGLIHFYTQTRGRLFINYSFTMDYKNFSPLILVQQQELNLALS